MSKGLADMLLGVLIVGGVTAVITVYAIVLARREDAEARLQVADDLLSEPVRRAS